MVRVPFGVSRLDAMIDGGAPAGSTVLLGSEVGAGGREFLYTTAVMNGLARADEEQFDLYYGDLEDGAELPTSVQYLSFTDDESALIEEMEYTMDEELVDTAADVITFEDFSEEYFQLSQVPSDWYATKTTDITSLGDRHDRRDVLEAVGEYLSRKGEGSLVVTDSVTDLISVASGEMDWTDIPSSSRASAKQRNGGAGWSSCSSPSTHSRRRSSDASWKPQTGPSSSSGRPVGMSERER